MDKNNGGLLDYLGLQRYHDRIEAALSEKQDKNSSDGVGLYTAGDGITIEDGTVSLDCPIRDLTQEAYDALSPEKQAKGLIFLPDDSPSGSSDDGSALEVYDDQERMIGTLFGKPLYRKTITGSIEVNPSNVDYPIISGVNVVAVKGYTEVKDWDSRNFLSWDQQRMINDTVFVENLHYGLSNSEFSIIVKTEVSLLSIDYCVTIEYTKTTDQEVTT